MKRFEHLKLEYPLGCIIARAKLTDCIYVDDSLKSKVVPKDPVLYRGIATKANWRGYGFKLEDVQEIKHINVNGKLSLWDYEYEQL